MNRWLGKVAAIASTLGAVPASAAVHQLQWSGVIEQIEGNAGGSGISVGDAISAAFQFDDAAATGPTILALGGGEYRIYGAPLTAITLNIGSYSVSYATHDGVLTYMNNTFGSDGIVFSLDGLPGGPFNSTFANIQFQARGPSSAINGSGLANGLPYSSLATSFFGAFGNGVTSERVFGSLSVSDGPEVPEPVTWIMLACGFCMIGGALRFGAEPAGTRRYS